MTEHLIEAIEMTLVFHEGRAGEIVEVFDAAFGAALLDRFEERQILLERHGHLGGAQFMEEACKHAPDDGPKRPARKAAKRRPQNVGRIDVAVTRRSARAKAGYAACR